MAKHSPLPVQICRAPMQFDRPIGIGVKDEKALSKSTKLFVNYVRTWVAENGEK